MRIYRQAATVLAIGMVLMTSAKAGIIYNNLTPNNLVAMASSPGIGASDIEAADDFLLTSGASITSASFTGLFVGTGSPSISQLVIEIYRVFPLDSNTLRTPNVPTRANSPSDVEFADRDSGAAGQLSFSTTTLAASFTALNSVHLGIHPMPNQTTNGEGPVTGQEVEIDVNFLVPFSLPADHYFFVPQVQLTSGQFYWLSASRPISGAGTTPFAPDLQAWIRNGSLDPDWLRVGTDIVGGTTFNAAFSLSGTSVPEPSSITLVIGGLALIGFRRTRGVTLSKGVDAVLCRRSNTPRP